MVVFNSSDGEAALFAAAQMNELMLIEALLKSGINAGAKRPNGANILWNCQEPRVIELLCAHGADPNAGTPGHGTQLTHILSDSSGDYAGVHVLLRYRADVNVRDEQQMTPFMWAALYASSSEVRALLDHGSDVRCKYKHGETALKLAKSRLKWDDSAEIIRTLKNAGAQM